MLLLLLYRDMEWRLPRVEHEREPILVEGERPAKDGNEYRYNQCSQSCTSNLQADQSWVAGIQHTVSEAGGYTR